MIDLPLSYLTSMESQLFRALVIIGLIGLSMVISYSGRSKSPIKIKKR